MEWQRRKDIIDTHSSSTGIKEQRENIFSFSEVDEEVLYWEEKNGDLFQRCTESSLQNFPDK